MLAHDVGTNGIEMPTRLDRLVELPEFLAQEDSDSLLIDADFSRQLCRGPGLLVHAARLATGADTSADP